MILAPAILLAYLLGSVPSSVILGRSVKGIDVREHGSGNAGASNAFRVLGRPLGVAVLLMDAGKGAAAVALIPALLRLSGGAQSVFGDTETRLLLGGAAIIGHVYSVFLNFRGGKGVGTAAGVLVVLYPLSLGIAVAIFVVVLLVTGITSLASLVASLSFPGVAALLGHLGIVETSPALFVFSVLAVLFLLFTHRENIKRLVAGRENRFEGARILGRLFDRFKGPGGHG
ncbi:MAG: glycerol-3-phosphate 1-O-acyltransferase PlsY [Spirochaetaceae bacterium]